MKIFLIRLLYLSLFVSFWSCQTSDYKFELLTPDRTGISFINQLIPTSELNILTYLYYYNGAGVAVADFNQDGLNDLYFSSNQGLDKLYLNKGNFTFEDITALAGIHNDAGWTTGIAHVDINNDGLLDLYICKVGAYKSIEGKNLLYVNQGINENGIPVFIEDAKSFGLDIVAFSTQTSFFDYDLDGDLDMYLLCHSVHPNRSYGRGSNRETVDSLSGDKLFENINGIYKDVTKSSGIFQGKIGYGLGLSIGDINEDGYPDIYIGNDFFENDYLYLNNGDKTFEEIISKKEQVLGHTTHYSMGNCISDVNNDGRLDILSLDMLPENLETLKASGVEDPYPTYDRYLKTGYSPQFMQNTLHLNRGSQMFSEVGFQSGIAATEWSWGVIAVDLDMDGYKDIYISNGILGATNDMDYISFIAQDHIQREIEDNKKGEVLNFINKIPEKKLNNYVFQNKGNATFNNVSDSWFNSIASFSNGVIASDLDNDGDLDIVVNNVNQLAFVYENHSNDDGSQNFLTIEFQGPALNKFGIGAKVEIYTKELYILEENYPVHSYLSASPNSLCIALGKNRLVDSLRVTWPDRKVNTIYKIGANRTLVLSYVDAAQTREISSLDVTQKNLLTNSDKTIEFVHREQTTLDFDRDPLVPYAQTNEGPGVGIADINADGREDIFICGAKGQASQLFVQNKLGAFENFQSELFETHAINEDIDQVFFDAEGDGDLDLLVVSGGNEFVTGKPLRPRLYINEDGRYRYDDTSFEGIFVNASLVNAFDFENDGDQDIIICSNALPGKFGESAENFLLRNNGKGVFENISSSNGQSLKDIGLVNAIEIRDMDNNGLDDIIVAGAWMPISILYNDGNTFTKSTISNTEGLWQSIGASDFDWDGDIDLVVGNWGLNTRLTASVAEPITLYRNDFDDNGNVETLITYFYKGNQTVLASKGELAKQLPFINKKFLSYNDFAKAEIGDIFPQKKLKEAIKKEVKLLSTTYFENKGKEGFVGHELSVQAQQSMVNDMIVEDFDKDGYDDVLLVGNNYELSTQLGRLDASHGVILLNDQKGSFTENTNQTFNVVGPARQVKKIVISNKLHYVVTINNGQPVFLKEDE